MDDTDNITQGHPGGAPRDDSTMEAWLIGGGIASLAAAVHLINDAQVPPSQIHILEARPTPGGSMALEPRGAPERKGYVIRAARKLNFSYRCLYDTLSRVPHPHPRSSPEPADEGFEEVRSEDGQMGTLLDYVRSGGGEARNRGRTKVRLVALGEGGPETVDTRTMGLEPVHQASLMSLILGSEESLGASTIRDAFEIGFFETNFWDMFSTMYLFKPWHGAVEFRRYLHRFLHEVPNMGSMAGVEYMPMNDFDAAVVPMVKYLEGQGVDFQYGELTSPCGLRGDANSADTTALSIDFAPGTDDIVVSNLALRCGGVERNVPIKPDDVVLATLGSMVSGSKRGTNTTPPGPLPKLAEIRQNPDPAWRLWLRLADPEVNRHAARFGDPRLFCEKRDETMGVAFTVTLFEDAFIDYLLEWAGSPKGICPLLSFRDCPWLLSITVPRQPYFAGQDPGTTVFWGYGLYPDQPGRFVQKPMLECSGREILTELLCLMGRPLEPTLGNSVTLPELMPLITSPYATRGRDSRPRVIPRGSRNLALMGQFVEMDEDVTFTMEYSVRSAQVGVYGLTGVKRRVAEVFGGDPSAAVLGEALKTMMI